MKARMDCPVLGAQLPYVIQDVYHWCGSRQHWRDCLFYAVFKPQAYVLNSHCSRWGGRGLFLSHWSLAWQVAHFLCWCVCVRETSDLSAVCVYRVSDVSSVFAEGNYKTPVTIETFFVKWVTYSGDVPVPRPGAVSLSSLS